MGKTKGLRGDARALERALSGKTRPRQKERVALERFRMACEKNDSAEAAKTLKDCPSLLTLQASDEFPVRAALSPQPVTDLTPALPARSALRSATRCARATPTACGCSLTARLT